VSGPGEGPQNPIANDTRVMQVRPQPANNLPAEITAARPLALSR
jgi:hypothetical protein